MIIIHNFCSCDIIPTKVGGTSHYGYTTKKDYSLGSLLISPQNFSRIRYIYKKYIFLDYYQLIYPVYRNPLVLRTESFQSFGDCPECGIEIFIDDRHIDVFFVCSLKTSTFFNCSS